jgi:hypothetical protein
MHKHGGSSAAPSVEDAAAPSSEDAASESAAAMEDAATPSVKDTHASAPSVAALDSSTVEAAVPEPQSPAAPESATSDQSMADTHLASEIQQVETDAVELELASGLDKGLAEEAVGEPGDLPSDQAQASGDVSPVPPMRPAVPPAISPPVPMLGRPAADELGRHL